MGKYKGKTYEERYGKEMAEKLKKKRSEFMKNNCPMWNEKSKIKSSISHIGKKLSPETCKKLSESKKGKLPKNVKLLEKSGEKTRFKKGMITWNKGKKHSKETRKKIGLANIGRKQSEETRIKRGIYIGRPLSKKEKKDISIRMKEWRKTKIFPKKDTSIEIKIQNLLKQLGIEFVTHQYIKDIKYGYQCDIFIPIQNKINQKTIIECDGDYWHGNLEKFNLRKLNKNIKIHRCLDYERTAQLEESGFRVIRLWEHEIKEMELNNLQQVVFR